METCNAVGCFKPRHKSTGGYEYSYCYDHWLQRMESFKWDGGSQGKVEIMRSDVCVVDGCNETRMRTEKGEILTMCREHQRAYWREQARRKDTKKKAKSEAVPQPVVNPVLVSDTIIQDAELVTVETNSTKHDCDTCEAKTVLEALKAKSPKLAALIDAMEAQERAANALGL